jgi:hypothetical protein
VLVDVLLVLDELVLELPLKVNTRNAGLRQPVDDTHHQVEAILARPFSTVMSEAEVMVPSSL